MIRAIFVAAAVSASCGGSTSQVEIRGDDDSMLALAGDWEGSYVGVDSGRKGTIRFSLTVGRHTAEGEVIMFPAGGPGEPRPLAVQFVKVGEGGQVTGTMEPYTDPQCRCRVVTEFHGQVDGDAIAGEFTTRAEGSERIQSGRWSAVRKQ